MLTSVNSILMPNNDKDYKNNFDLKKLPQRLVLAVPFWYGIPAHHKSIPDVPPNLINFLFES